MTACNANSATPGPHEDAFLERRTGLNVDVLPCVARPTGRIEPAVIPVGAQIELGSVDAIVSRPAAG